jgi:hypothetical protein
MTERELILSLCKEAREDVSNPDEVEAGFRRKHLDYLIKGAASGDTQMLALLRHECGLTPARHNA